MRLRLLRIHLLSLWFGAALTALARPPADPEAPWNALIATRPQDVLREFSDGGSTREQKLAWGVARIGAQPATDDSMREADAVLAELAKGDDDIAAEAAYFQARIYQVHLSTPDYAKAAELYTALAARMPASHWAQLGLVKLGLLKLYVLPDSTAANADRLAPAEAVLARISEPLLQRDLNLQIAQAGIALHQPLLRLLPHFVAADRVGGFTGNAREDLLVQIGVLSTRAGLWAQAKVYLERYLREFPTNVRAYTIRLKLEETNRHLAAKGGA